MLIAQSKNSLKYYYKNREKKLVYGKQYYKDNKDKAISYAIDYFKDPVKREERKIYMRNYHLKRKRNSKK